MENLEKHKRSNPTSKRRHTKPCSYFQTGNCRFSDEECDFLHVVSDTTAPYPHLRAKPCRFHLAGHCRNGDACRFKHEDDGSRQDDAPPSLLDRDYEETLAQHMTIDSGEWNQVPHHQYHPLSPMSFSSGMPLSHASPVYSSSVPYSVVNVKDSGGMYPHSPLWIPSPGLTYDTYPYEVPSSPSNAPISPYQYHEDMYFYPFSPLYANPYHSHPHSCYGVTPALLSPATSFDSATSTTSTDHWMTPPSTGNSVSTGSVGSIEEGEDDYSTSHGDKGSDGEGGEERLQRHQPSFAATSVSSRPEPRLIIPYGLPVAPAPSPVEVPSSASVTPVSIPTPLGAANTPKCQSPDSRPRSRKDVQKLAKYKTKPCKYWKVAATCPHGDDCTFIHNEKPDRVDAYSQASPVSTTSDESSDSHGSKHNLPEKPLTEIEEKRKRGFFPISWRVIGGGVLMGKPSKANDLPSQNTASTKTSKEHKLPASIDTSPTLIKFPSIMDSPWDTHFSAELSFESAIDRAPKSATIVPDREKDVVWESGGMNGSSHRARATSIPSTPRAATFLGGTLFAAAESPGNL